MTGGRAGSLREALDALLSLDPERGEMRGWGSYWSELMLAYWALDQHEEALKGGAETSR